jgi:hypothetical protein
MPWFRSIVQEQPWHRFLACPLCRQRVLLIRYSFTLQGEYKALGIKAIFVGIGDGRCMCQILLLSLVLVLTVVATFPSPGEPQPANLRRRYVRGQPKTLIRSVHGRNFLDFEVINRMGPLELEGFISDIRRLAPGQFSRVNSTHQERLTQRILAFRSLSSEGSFLTGLIRRTDKFPGYNPDDSLDIDGINRMSRQELANFRDVLNNLGEFERFSPQDIERFQQRSEALRLEDILGNGGPAEPIRPPRSAWED